MTSPPPLRAAPGYGVPQRSLQGAAGGSAVPRPARSWLWERGCSARKGPGGLGLLSGGNLREGIFFLVGRLEQEAKKRCLGAAAPELKAAAARGSSDPAGEWGPRRGEAPSRLSQSASLGRMKPTTKGCAKDTAPFPSYPAKCLSLEGRVCSYKARKKDIQIWNRNLSLGSTLPGKATGNSYCSNWQRKPMVEVAAGRNLAHSIGKIEEATEILAVLEG